MFAVLLGKAHPVFVRLVEVVVYIFFEQFCLVSYSGLDVWCSVVRVQDVVWVGRRGGYNCSRY